MPMIFLYECTLTRAVGFIDFLKKMYFKYILFQTILKDIVIFGLKPKTMPCFASQKKIVFGSAAMYFCRNYADYRTLHFIYCFPNDQRFNSLTAARLWSKYTTNHVWPGINSILAGTPGQRKIIWRTSAAYSYLAGPKDQLNIIGRPKAAKIQYWYPRFKKPYMTAARLRGHPPRFEKPYKTWPEGSIIFPYVLTIIRSPKVIRRPYKYRSCIYEFNEFRTKCGILWCYDWVSIPLVYTQVVTLATYCFFLACIIGRQYVDEEKYKRIDLYVPYFTLLQFFFYMGLLKVAEQLINPFGDDDEDFELNWIIDRHMKVSYLIVDTLLLRTPPLTKDIFFDEASPVLPYTEASATFKKRTYRGSVANMVVPEEKQNLILPDIQEEFEDEGGGSNLLSSKRSSSTNIAESARFTKNLLKLDYEIPSERL
ncbi:unnamed protein product, partial [Meganyctiphanes norvegica]